MSGSAPFRNEDELDRIKAIAGTPEDGPVLMMNLNRYSEDAGYPDGALYRRYMTVLHELLPRVGGKILWRSGVIGQAVGKQDIDEILAAWYPSHQAFLDLPQAPGADENFRLRRECVAEAVIHRCSGDLVPLDGS